MFLVAILEISGPVEAEAAALAEELGSTAYEERLRLVRGTPCIVLATPDREVATAMLARIRGRGHGAIAIDDAAIVPSEDLVSMQRFRIERGGLAVDGADLPWTDVSALVRAVHRSTTETRTETKTKKLSLGRALLSSGLVLTKTTTTEERTRANDSQQVLYIYRASGETPWILRERGTAYTALGALMSPSSAQSFQAAVALFRREAPAAAYDDRLASPRAMKTEIARATRNDGETVTATSASAVDVAAHLVALWLTRRGRQ